jgi:hypothetical protein
MKNFISIVAVAALMLAMAAPAMASVDYSGLTTISTDAALVTDARIAPSGGSSGTINIVAGGTFNTDGELRFGENGVYAEISVQVGGHLQADVEALFNEGEISNMATRLNVYGTAYVEQLKFAQAGNDNEIVVGNGTDAATLVTVEGYCGKNGDANITVNDNSTFVVGGDWSNAWKISAGVTPTDSYIYLNDSGTFQISTAVTTSWYDSNIKGNGVLDNWVMTTGTYDGDPVNIYTAVPVPEPATMSLLAIGGLALLRRKRRA